MTKVVNVEETNYNSSKIKKTALRGLTVLLLSTSVMLSGCKGKEVVNSNMDYKASNQITDVVKIVVDDINLLLTEPQAEVTGEITIYNPPAGFSMSDSGVCYKLTVNNKKAPAGYSLGMDNETIYQVDTEIDYYAPEGYILVGSKIVKVLPVSKIENKNEYDIHSKYGVIIEEAPLRKVTKI